MKIKMIAFDMNGVLMTGNYPKKAIRSHKTNGVHSTIIKNLKIDLDTWFDAIDTPYADSIEGKISRAKTVNTISKNLGISKSKLENVVIKAYRKHFKKNKELYKIIKKLKKEGYQISLLSDQWHLSKEALISRKDNIFKPKILSCDEGVRKPNPKIYKLLIKKSKLKPEEIIFIDNREWNTKPAEKLKIKTILFKNNKQLLSELNKCDINIK